MATLVSTHGQRITLWYEDSRHLLDEFSRFWMMTMMLSVVDDDSGSVYCC